MDDAAKHIFHWIESNQQHYVCVRDIHGIVLSQTNDILKQIHAHSGLTVPDGMPLVRIGRWLGHGNMDRVYGPDLMHHLCKMSVKKGYTHCLYGGKSQYQAQTIQQKLKQQYKGIQITGAFCPPYDSFKSFDDQRFMRHIRDKQPNIIWIGVSTPKQEYIMMHLHRQSESNVLIGVGAAFDIVSGVRNDAPQWIKTLCLQWLFRLLQEPSRLGPRYLKTIPTFFGLLIQDMIKRQKD